MKIQQTRRKLQNNHKTYYPYWISLSAKFAAVYAFALIMRISRQNELAIMEYENITGKESGQTAPTSFATRSIRSATYSATDSKQFKKEREYIAATSMGKSDLRTHTRAISDASDAIGMDHPNDTRPDEGHIFKDSVKPLTSGMTKTIWMYWEQGTEHVSPKDSRCVEAWATLNPNWKVRLLSKDTIDEELAPLFFGIAHSGISDEVKKVTKPMRSDLLRLELLSRYGGVWADTSVCPLVELDSFITDWLGSGADGMYAPKLGLSSRRASDLPKDTASCHDKEFAGNAKRFRTASSWFLASAGPHNPLIDEWLRIYHGHLLDLTKRSLPYYVMHCSLTQARMNNATVDDIWFNTKQRLNQLPKTDLLKKHPCFSSKKNISRNMTWYKNNCVLIKRKGSQPVIDYLLSSDYYDDINQRLINTTLRLSENL